MQAIQGGTSGNAAEKQCREGRKEVRGREENGTGTRTGTTSIGNVAERDQGMVTAREVEIGGASQASSHKPGAMGRSKRRQGKTSKTRESKRGEPTRDVSM